MKGTGTATPRAPKSVEKLHQLPCYEQDSGAGILYQFVVRPGAMGLMSAGRVRAQGPTTKALDIHKGWDQIYIVLRGAGTMILGKRRHRISAGSIVRIPQGTLHGVELKKGQRIEYIYVNAFENRKALDRLIKTANL